MADRHQSGARRYRGWLLVLLLGLATLQSSCQPTPEANVLGYLLSVRLGTVHPPVPGSPTGALAGRVLAGNEPVAGATVVVAERTGTPHTAQTDAQGRYVIAGIPPGQYVPAAVAPGFRENALTGLLGVPKLVTIAAGATATAADLQLVPLALPALPAPLPQAVALRQTDSFTATAPFPEGAVAQGQAFAFDYAGLTVDSLRLYLPLDAVSDRRYPLLFFVFPSIVEDWVNVSVAFAAQGYAVVALSPMPQRGTNADAQAQDARVALALARSGVLSPAIGTNRPVALGGSYSSAVLVRLLRSAGDELAGWVTVGGLADAFAGAADYYAGRIQLPPPYELLVPALGWPDLYPLEFLRYSPVYVAGELPPTMIIHTAADRILPLAQAEALAAATRAAGVPTETYYYADESHYLGIGENLTDAGREMFGRILAFVERYGAAK